LFNLSKLSVWWLRLGIQIERIKPGHPQQNGRHERMHLTKKKLSRSHWSPRIKGVVGVGSYRYGI
jgi:transposase InsO family protein